MTSTEPTYTLGEARRLLAIEQCGREGHDLYDGDRRLCDEAATTVNCARCGTTFQDTSVDITEDA